MNKQFPRVLREIRWTLNQLFFFEVFLNAIVLFLAIYLLLVLAEFNYWLAAIPTAVYFILALYYKGKINKQRLVEKKHDPLDERLRTATDNIGVDNPIVDELEYEVIKEMKNVRLSEFLNARSMSYKILLVIVLSFSVLLSSSWDVQFTDLSSLGLFGAGGDQQRTQGAGDFDAKELNKSDDIYGDDRVANLGNDDLDIKIKPVDFKVSVKEEGEIKTGNFNDIFTQNAYVKEGEESQEEIPKEQQELVKNYFKQLAQS